MSAQTTRLLKPHYRDIKLAEMMQYYTPRWMAYVGIFASIASAFQLPMFGFILSQYVFVLAMPLTTAAERADFDS
jgi:ATP-binding cassette subfamily B (MDR/TAP) protein 1